MNILQVILVIVCYELGRYVYRHLTTPRYRWTCPVCHRFKVSATDQRIVDEMKKVHVHSELPT